MGLSPLTRENHASPSTTCPANGPIPAHAGEPFGDYFWAEGFRAYPRSRGGTFEGGATLAYDWGLSPLTRGNRCLHTTHVSRSGPIPAHAGEPFHRANMPPLSGAYPRSRGGTGPDGRRQGLYEGLSPLTRGNRRTTTFAGVWGGPIPAHAGEPVSDVNYVDHRWAYPRSRGGTAKPGSIICFDEGLSPLTRGNLADAF